MLEDGDKSLLGEFSMNFYFELLSILPFLTMLRRLLILSLIFSIFVILIYIPLRLAFYRLFGKSVLTLTSVWKLF
jgi:hypothetical protein